VEPEVMSYPSQAVNLRCAFADAGVIQLTQVSVRQELICRQMDMFLQHEKKVLNDQTHIQELMSGLMAFTVITIYIH
jgi:hypothetical protein